MLHLLGWVFIQNKQQNFNMVQEDLGSSMSKREYLLSASMCVPIPSTEGGASQMLPAPLLASLVKEGGFPAHKEIPSQANKVERHWTS